MSSTLVAPLLIYRPFGADAANPTYIKLPIPDPDQTGITVNQASFATGFPPTTMTPEASGGLPMFGQDLNGILWMISAYSANFAAGAFSKFNATLATAISGYPVGAIVQNSSGVGLWLNLTDGNSNNPNTGGAGWVSLVSNGKATQAITGGTLALTALQAAQPLIVISGALAGSAAIVLPPNVSQQWVIVNLCSGAFPLTVKTAAGTGVIIPATGYAAPTSIYCDGAATPNIQNTGISTAGLAPIASPALTGTPTAPTASPATTNTTQIATTAFAQAAITAALAIYAKLASPIFSGNPTVPTQAPTDNSLRIANTAFVHALLASLGALTGDGHFAILGFMIQWGKVIGGSGAPQTVGFDIPFGNNTAGNCWAVVATATPVNGTINVSDPLADDSQFILQNGAAGNNTSWIAVGKAPP